MIDPRPAAGILLAGGRGSRLGGTDKPAIALGGTVLIERALAALGAVPTVVVGPERVLSRSVMRTREDPAWAGPAAALAAGVDRLNSTVGVVLKPSDLVAVLATDLPAITAETLARLTAAVVEAAGAVLVDEDGREQLLLGVWRLAALIRAREVRPDWTGESVRAFLAPLPRVAVPAVGEEGADIDTPDQLAHWAAGATDH